MIKIICKLILLVIMYVIPAIACAEAYLCMSKSGAGFKGFNGNIQKGNIFGASDLKYVE